MYQLQTESNDIRLGKPYRVRSIESGNLDVWCAIQWSPRFETILSLTVRLLRQIFKIINENSIEPLLCASNARPSPQDTSTVGWLWICCSFICNIWRLFASRFWAIKSDFTDSNNITYSCIWNESKMMKSQILRYILVLRAPMVRLVPLGSWAQKFFW